MINKLNLKNFRGFEDISLRLKPITLIYGQNSSGKSSLVRSILFLRQLMLDGRLRDPVFVSPYYNLGSFKNTVRDNRLDREIEVGVLTKASGQPWVTLTCGVKPDRASGTPITSRLVIGGRVEGETDFTRVSVVSDEPEGSVQESEEAGELSKRSTSHAGKQDIEFSLHPDDEGWRFDNATIEGWAKSDKWNAWIEEENDQIIKEWNKEKDKTDEKEIEFEKSKKRPVPLAKWMPQKRSFDLEEVLLDIPLSKWSIAASEALESTRYVGPLRQLIGRSPIKMGDLNYVGPDGENTASLLAYHASALHDVNEVLSAQLEVPHTLKAEKFQHPYLGSQTTIAVAQGDDDNGGDDTVSEEEPTDTVLCGLQDVGIGVSQLLPIITQLAVQTGGTLIVEQPELHLHPKLQANLAESMVRAAGHLLVNDRYETPIDERNQLIIESHSELLLLRLQKLVRARKLNPDDLLVVYVHPADREAQRIEEIEIDSDGYRTAPWPHGFFEERFDEEDL